MAIEKDILMATAFTPENTDHLRCELHNVVMHFAHTTFQCDLMQPETIELTHIGMTRWSNYFKAALRGLQSVLPADVLRSARGTIHILVDGSVPAESSLSSSAAMTTSSMIAVLTALRATHCMTRQAIADLACRSERLVGVNSGGMDQAVSMFGQRDHAIYVSFVPSLRTTPIMLPIQNEYLFLVTNTMMASDKKVHAPVQYNLRVVETRIAACALKRILGTKADMPFQFPQTLRAVSDTYWLSRPGALDKMMEEYDDVKMAFQDLGKEAAQLQAMLNIVEASLPRCGLSRTEVEELVGLHGQDFDQTFLSDFPIHANQFFLHARAFHVYSEALRVLQFRSVLERTRARTEQGAPVDLHRVAHHLGSLMNASHESLRNDYDCSSSELDLIVCIARKQGALGSRLTGAGWGGCAVHLIHRDCMHAIMHSLKELYYSIKFGYLKESQLEEVMFPTHPAEGACVVHL